MNEKPRLSKAFIDMVSFLSGLVGIFGFITGITSIPYFFTTSTNNPTGTATWFGWIIPWYLSIGVFAFTIVFVYGVYFLVLLRVYKWLYHLGVVDTKKGKNKYDLYYFSDQGNLFTTWFFVAFGIAIGLLIVPAFFQIPETAQEWSDAAIILAILFVGSLAFVPALIAFLVLLCDAARESAIRGETELRTRR